MNFCLLKGKRMGDKKIIGRSGVIVGQLSV